MKIVQASPEDYERNLAKTLELLGDVPISANTINALKTMQGNVIKVCVFGKTQAIFSDYCLPKTPEESAARRKQFDATCYRIYQSQLARGISN